MNFFLKICLITFFPFSFSFSLVGQDSMVFQPGPNEGKDALVHTIFPSTNLGNSPNTIAAAWTYSGEFGIIRSLLQFDLSSISPPTIIDSALLSLYYNPTCGHEGHGGSNAAYIRKVIGNWDEQAVTWNTKPTATTSNQVFLPASLTTYQDYTGINVTNLVQDMINNPSQNHGFLLILETEDIYRSLTFASSDHPNAALHPKLEVFLGCRIDLGPDTLICYDSIFTLSAGSGFSEYLWSTGETDSTINITTSGTYWVNAVTEFGCFATDTIQVELIPGSLSFNLGADTTLCYNDEIILQAGEGFDTYLWQDGSTQTDYLVTNPGVYSVEVSNQCGSFSDSIVVDFYPEYSISLGADTNICYGDVLLLNPGFGFVNYLWQDGSDLPFFEVNESGIYSVTVTDINQCQTSDDIIVNVNQIPLNLGNDTSICENTEITLTVSDDMNEVIWMDSISNDHQFIVQEPGVYWVNVSENFGNVSCEASDTIIVGLLNAPHQPDLLDSYGLCNGTSLNLDAYIGDDYSYIWNENYYGSSIQISYAGMQRIEIYNACGSFIDSIEIVSLPSPAVHIEQLDMKEAENYILKIDSIYSEILWNTGSDHALIKINSPGNYVVNVWNEYGCQASDSVLIEPIVCIQNIPQLFTPNGDSRNDYFYIENSYTSTFNILIFNRWGEEVFKSSDSQFKWDGKRKGTDCSDGTYYYIISYTCSSQSSASPNGIIKGNVLLLR